MARTPIDSMVGRWRENSLLDGASFFHPEAARDCWSVENTRDLYDRFVGNPILGSEGGGTFASKWEEQLQDATPEVRLLAAECLTIYYFFTQTVGYERKVEMVNDTIRTEQWLVSDSDDDPMLHQALHSWIANPGARYNTRQDRQMAYLIDFCRRFMSLELDERRELLDDNPWQFMAFADDTDELPDAMRHVVCHLLYPDYFERISSTNHKSQILAAFSALYEGFSDEGVDQRLYGIRRELEKHIQGGEAERDFYSENLEPIWRPASGGASQISPLSALRRKKQIVFHGPPGTGKTYTAGELAETLIRSAAVQRWGVPAYFSDPTRIEEALESHVTHLQLHPGIDYSEFIAGLQIGEGGKTEYRNGVLLDLVDDMQRQRADGLSTLPHVLILDEINRTDLSAMLGEAFSAMEADKRGRPVKLPATDRYGENLTLVIPEELYIIGTMNEIDHSVESLDFALRRRFLWFDAPFDDEALRAIWKNEWAKERPRVGYEESAHQLEHLITNIESLNLQIADTPDLGRAYHIGHAFFSDLAFLVAEAWPGHKPPKATILWTASGRPQPPMENLWTFSIRPLLEQYLAGSDRQDTMLESFRSTLLAPPGNR